MQTVNAELQSKVDALSRTNNEMQNLLNSTNIATVFRDGMLKVRRFSASATRLIKLLSGDVGRPLSDIATELDKAELHADAQQALHTLVYCQKEAPTHDGHWYSIRIMPYHTLDDVFDGVLITLVNITAAKTLEAQLRQTADDASPTAGNGT